MSSILKALKKLEHEKSVRKPSSFKIDAEILRATSPRRPFYASPTLAAITLFLCGAVAAYLYMKFDKTLTPVQIPQVSANRVKGEPSPGITPAPVSSTPAEEQKPGPPAKAAISLPEKSGPSPRAVKKQQQVQRVLQPVVMLPQTAASEPKPVSLPLPVAPVAPPPKSDLKVNGIAFQDGTDSVAVINGITVSKGSVIEGARVEEIQKDRVRFSRGGEKFDIILDKSN